MNTLVTSQYQPRTSIKGFAFVLSDIYFRSMMSTKLQMSRCLFVMLYLCRSYKFTNNTKRK